MALGSGRARPRASRFDLPTSTRPHCTLATFHLCLRHFNLPLNLVALGYTSLLNDHEIKVTSIGYMNELCCLGRWPQSSVNLQRGATTRRRRG